MFQFICYNLDQNKLLEILLKHYVQQCLTYCFNFRMMSRGKRLVQKALQEITNISPGNYVVNEDGTLSPTPAVNTPNENLPDNASGYDRLRNYNETSRPTDLINRPNANHEVQSITENNDLTDLPMIFDFIEQNDADLLSNEFQITDLNVTNLSTGETGITDEVEKSHSKDQDKIEQNEINQIEGFGSVVVDQGKSRVGSDLRDKQSKRVQEAAIDIDNQGTSDSESELIGKETGAINNDNNTTEDLSTTDNHHINIEPEVLKRSRKKRHKVDTKTWKINEWKTSRKLGKAYKGKKTNRRRLEVQCRKERKSNEGKMQMQK